MNLNSDATLNDSQVDQLIDILWSSSQIHGESGNVCAILDGAKNPKIYPMIHNSGLDNTCLFSGQLSYAMMRAAPHVVKLEKSHRFTRDIIRASWGMNWGIFVVADASINISIIRNHCRRIAKVNSPNNKPLYFRYYDPSILSAILPVCSNDEIMILFGPFTYIAASINNTEHPNWTYLYRDKDTLQLIKHSINIIDELQPVAPYTPFAYRQPFQLRQAHIDVFEKKADIEFFKEAYKSYLRCYNDDPKKLFLIDNKQFNLPSFLWRCYLKGVEYKLETAYCFTVFFHLASQYGWEFWKNPEYKWITEILQQPRPAEIRIAKIEQRLSAQLMDRMWS